MNKRDLQFIVSHIDAVRETFDRRFDSFDRRLDRIESRLDTVIDTLADHIATAHGDDT